MTKKKQVTSPAESNTVSSVIAVSNSIVVNNSKEQRNQQTHQHDSYSDKETANYLNLQEQIDSVDKKLDEYKEISQSDVDDYMNLIHEYNEIKDLGQSLVGRYARLQGKSTSEIYDEHFSELKDAWRFIKVDNII